jgi:hypothetical protein
MLPTRQDKLEEDKDSEEMEEKARINLERGKGTPNQNKGIPENKNRKILSETISDQNQSQWSV